MMIFLADAVDLLFDSGEVQYFIAQAQASYSLLVVDSTDGTNLQAGL